MNRGLLGADYKNALLFIGSLVDLNVITIPSGTQLGTWTVPTDWILHDAWVKNDKGEKIIDVKKDPLCVMHGSTYVKGKVSREELLKHLTSSDEMPNAVPYTFSFYEPKWGFNVRKNDFTVPNDDPMAGVKLENGEEFVPKFKSSLPEGEYEVLIDSERREDDMLIGVHTIKGETDREILLFAHLDHPYQANDNLSGVACLLDLANKLKAKHTIKIIFCPETIGSVAYALTQDISKVDFVLAIDICGNNNEHTLQIPLRPNRITDCFNLALKSFGESFKMGKFRTMIGSDEYPFNDPLIDIPGLLLTRFPYPEYHTSEDTPDKICYDKIERTGEVVMKAIEIYEKDYIPVKNFKGPLMRSRYGIQTGNPQMNLAWDYLMYSMDGKKTLAELCVGYGIDFGLAYDTFYELINAGKILRIAVGEREVQETSLQEHKGLPRKANVSGERRKVSKNIR